MSSKGYRSRLTLGSIAACITFACADATAPVAPVVFTYTCEPAVGPDLGVAQQAVLDSLSGNGRRNINDELADVARVVPGGWGGLFQEDGQLAMYLVDTTKYTEAVAALNETDLFRFFNFSPYRVKKGLWDLAQLHDWRLYIVNQGVLWPDGLISSTTDIGRNRLVYGVRPEKGYLVEEFFSVLHLPCDLLLIEEGSILVADSPAPPL